MAETTPRLGLYKPADDGSEPVNVATDINDNLEKLDASVGAAPATTSTPPPGVFDGMFRQNTDDESLYYYRNNSVWTQIWSKGAAFASDALLTLGSKLGVGTLTPGAVLDAIVGNAADLLVRMRVTGDAQPRIQIESTGISMGPGGVTPTDVRIYRLNAATLNIDGNLVVEDSLQVNGTPSFTGGVNITGATNIDGDTNLTGGADIEDHITFEGFPVMVGQRGAVILGTATPSAVVNFGRTYPTAPTVICNFNGGAGSTASWSARALSITTTGFTAFITGPTSSFSGVTVNWVAFHEGF